LLLLLLLVLLFTRKHDKSNDDVGHLVLERVKESDSESATLQKGEKLLSSSSSDRHERADPLERPIPSPGPPRELWDRSSISARCCSDTWAVSRNNGKDEDGLSPSSSAHPKLAVAYKAAHPLPNSLSRAIEPLPKRSRLLQRQRAVRVETAKKKSSSFLRPATATSAQVPLERPRPSPGPPRARWNRSPLSARCCGDT
jgi:hypothetical protein